MFLYTFLYRYGYNFTSPDWFLGFEFYSSEILAFHLDRRVD